MLFYLFFGMWFQYLDDVIFLHIILSISIVSTMDIYRGLINLHCNIPPSSMMLL
jgi:hypothetical protein